MIILFWPGIPKYQSFKLVKWSGLNRAKLESSTSEFKGEYKVTWVDPSLLHVATHERVDWD